MVFRPWPRVCLTLLSCDGATVSHIYPQTKSYHHFGMICLECSKHFKNEVGGVPLKDLSKISESVHVWSEVSGQYVREQAQEGCEICTRLDTALTSYLGHIICPSTDGHRLQNHDARDSLLIYSWIRFQEGASREPTAIRFLFMPESSTAFTSLEFNPCHHHKGESMPQGG